MTNAFPDVALHQAAAALYEQLASHPHPADVDSFFSTVPACAAVDGSEEHDDLRGRVMSLVRGAADVSEWAVELGAADLTPFHAYLWRTQASEDFAVQLAAGEALAPALRRVLTTAIHEAVEGAYAQFMNQVPKTYVPAAVR